MAREKIRRWIRQGRWSLLIAIMPLLLGGWWAFVGFAETADPDPQGPFGSPATVEELSSFAFSEVEGQLREATGGRNTGPSRSWSSQPGAIRQFTDLDPNYQVFKLYSAKDMVVWLGERDFSEDVEVEWDTQPDHFVDLNAPTVSSGGELVFPIADPRNFGGSDNSNSAEGFSYVEGINGVVLPDPVQGSDDAQRLPMPVRWRYVFKNGLVGTLDDENRWDGRTPTESNPVVGRVAYWTDDLSCRINVNTASEGVYWDTPRADTIEERAYAEMQPARDEFQRQPGHPAQVSLSSVLYPKCRYYLPGTTGELDALTLAEAEQLWRIAPGVGTGGSKGGTRRILGDETPVPAEPASYQLYKSLEDVAASNPALPAEVLQRLDRSGFLLTTDSNAPETSLAGTPRIAMWPVPKDAEARSPFDQKMVSAGTLGEDEYFIQRSSSKDLHRDRYCSANLFIPGFLNAGFRSVPGYNQQALVGKVWRFDF